MGYRELEDHVTTRYDWGKITRKEWYAAWREARRGIRHESAFREKIALQAWPLWTKLSHMTSRLTVCLDRMDTFDPIQWDNADYLALSTWSTRDGQENRNTGRPIEDGEDFFLSDRLPIWL